jgi:hypothetical protein
MIPASTLRLDIVNARTTAYEEIRHIGARLRANGTLRQRVLFRSRDARSQS